MVTPTHPWYGVISSTQDFIYLQHGQDSISRNEIYSCLLREVMVQTRFKQKSFLHTPS